MSVGAAMGLVAGLMCRSAPPGDLYGGGLISGLMNLPYSVGNGSLDPDGTGGLVGALMSLPARASGDDAGLSGSGSGGTDSAVPDSPAPAVAGGTGDADVPTQSRLGAEAARGWWGVAAKELGPGVSETDIRNRALQWMSANPGIAMVHVGDTAQSPDGVAITPAAVDAYARLNGGYQAGLADRQLGKQLEGIYQTGASAIDAAGQIQDPQVRANIAAWEQRSVSAAQAAAMQQAHGALNAADAGKLAAYAQATQAMAAAHGGNDVPAGGGWIGGPANVDPATGYAITPGEVDPGGTRGDGYQTTPAGMSGFELMYAHPELAGSGLWKGAYNDIAGAINSGVNTATQGYTALYTAGGLAQNAWGRLTGDDDLAAQGRSAADLGIQLVNHPGSPVQIMAPERYTGAAERAWGDVGGAGTDLGLMWLTHEFGGLRVEPNLSGPGTLYSNPVPFSVLATEGAADEGALPVIQGAWGDTIHQRSSASYGADEAGSADVQCDISNSSSASGEYAGAQPKPYANPASRPKYADGQVDSVWTAAQDEDGNVYDPNTGEILTWDKSRSRFGQWDMGHLPGKEYNILWRSYMNDEIDLDQFLSEYRSPSNYRPESPSANRSHRYESKVN